MKTDGMVVVLPGADPLIARWAMPPFLSLTAGSLKSYLQKTEEGI
jgi:hypothetical protein